MSFSHSVGWYGGGNSLPGAADHRGSGSHVVVLASLLQSSEYCCGAHNQLRTKSECDDKTSHRFCLQSKIIKEEISAPISKTLSSLVLIKSVALGANFCSVSTKYLLHFVFFFFYSDSFKHPVVANAAQLKKSSSKQRLHMKVNCGFKTVCGKVVQSMWGLCPLRAQSCNHKPAITRLVCVWPRSYATSLNYVSAGGEGKWCPSVQPRHPPFTLFTRGGLATPQRKNLKQEAKIPHPVDTWLMTARDMRTQVLRGDEVI